MSPSSATVSAEAPDLVLKRLRGSGSWAVAEGQIFARPITPHALSLLPPQHTDNLYSWCSLFLGQAVLREGFGGGAAAIVSWALS